MTELLLEVVPLYSALLIHGARQTYLLFAWSYVIRFLNQSMCVNYCDAHVEHCMQHGVWPLHTCYTQCLMQWFPHAIRIHATVQTPMHPTWWPMLTTRWQIHVISWLGGRLPGDDPCWQLDIMVCYTTLQYIILCDVMSCYVNHSVYIYIYICIYTHTYTHMICYIILYYIIL